MSGEIKQRRFRHPYKITGIARPMPKKDRPKCKWCGKVLEPVWDFTFPTSGESSKAFNGKYGKGEGNFCRELHALWWADHTIARIRAGELIATEARPEWEERITKVAKPPKPSGRAPG